MKIHLNHPKAKNYSALVWLTPKNIEEKKLNKNPSVLKKALKDKLFNGNKNEVLFLPYTSAGHGKHLILIGLGDSKELNPQSYRHAAGLAYQTLTHKKLSSACIDLSSIYIDKKDEAVQAVVEGLSLAGWRLDDFKQKKEPCSLKEVFLLTSEKSSNKKVIRSTKQAVDEGLTLSKAVNFARKLSDTPGNLMTPSILAEEVRKKMAGTAVKTTIWNKDKIKKEKMGGLLGVSLGSGQEPRFIIMEYKGGKPSDKPIAFVGKGLTFDSGGISIKPASRMDEMKFDMCGSAAVIGTMWAISQMKLKLNVITLVPSSENMPGANANKPGDILKARNGKTMEVLNTDAEGRLILADALSYACEKKPAAIFDAATLTGAMGIALGNSHTGFYTKHSDLRKRIWAAGEISGENVWPMPLTEDHANDIRSAVADVANIATEPQGAGSATAAAFLEHFVDKKIPWAHFDIAGTASNVSKRLSYCHPKGASGVMVRTFYHLAKSYI